VQRYSLLLLLTLPFASVAQKSPPATPSVITLADGTELPVDAETHLITYQGVIEAPGLTQAQLYTRAHDWLARTSSIDNTPQPQNAATDQLITKGSWPVTITAGLAGTLAAGFVQYTLSIYLKDGRYKYVLSNLTHGSPGGGHDVAAAGPLEQANVQLIPMGGKRYWNQVRKQADMSARKLVVELQNAMKGPAKDPKDF
jgi:hypothetical protein